MRKLFRDGSVVLPDRVIEDGAVLIDGDRIVAAGHAVDISSGPEDAEKIGANGGYIVPGYIDMHVHGGRGADFMDGTLEAFRTILAAHAEHGTTCLAVTTTVARHEQILAVLELCRQAKEQAGPGIWDGERSRFRGARVLGCHFYGPYFGPAAVGCHPSGPLRTPRPEEYSEYLKFSDAIVTATIAPELPGAELFARAAAEQGIRLNIGHSNATFDQVAAAVQWGARHVDHLYCAMSDKTKLRREQTYPMRGGVLEATFFFDELTTEVIADGKHLSADLLRMALKLKGVDRLALVTDCNRALDMPDGEYLFGPLDGGEPFIRRDDVGIMPDLAALASGCMGMDHMVRTWHQMTGAPLFDAIRMASLTPASILGCAERLGSLEAGKAADILVLDRGLQVRQVYIAGERLDVGRQR